MEKKMLNVAWLNGATPIGKGGGSSSGGSSSQTKWTGHADVEGLKAIGWTDEDIAYYQENGVNWNEEDDQYHKVPEDNIALYGVLKLSNISTYKKRIVYLPKIDIGSTTSLSGRFSGCSSMVAIPQLDTSNVTIMSSMFSNCSTLVSIPPLNTSKVTNMSSMFELCSSLVSIPQLDTSNVTIMSNMFTACYSLSAIPQLDTSKVTNMSKLFYNASSLVIIPQLDTSKVTNMSSMFSYNVAIRFVSLKALANSISIDDTELLTKDSLLYLINNEAAVSAITITLSSYCYNKYSSDSDVVAALANHPNISIAS